MENVQHECPKCKTIMRKLDLAKIETRRNNTKDSAFAVGICGTSGTTTTTTTSIPGYTDIIASRVYPSEPGPTTLKKKELLAVKGIPYECPTCGHRLSFRS